MNPPVVVSIQRRSGGARFEIHHPTPDLRAELRGLGVRRHLLRRRVFDTATNDDAHLADVVETLAAFGVAFRHWPHGWPPSAVAQHLRDEQRRDFAILALTDLQSQHHVEEL